MQEITPLDPSLSRVSLDPHATTTATIAGCMSMSGAAMGANSIQTVPMGNVQVTTASGHPPPPMGVPYHLDGNNHVNNHNPATEILDPKMPREWNWCGENYIHVDRFFLVAMPMLFLVFNVVYWMSYGAHFFLEEEVEMEKY